MKRLLAVLLVAAIISGARISYTISLSSGNPGSSLVEAEAIRFTDISGDYLFIKNLRETERMSHSLRSYLGDDSIQIQTTVPEDTGDYAGSTWDPAWVAALPGGQGYCVESWDIFKNEVFQKTSYQVCRI